MSKKDDNICIVCGKKGAVQMDITDGYMDRGKFFVCPDGNCHRKIVHDGVAVWQSKLDSEKETPK